MDRSFIWGGRYQGSSHCFINCLSILTLVICCQLTAAPVWKIQVKIPSGWGRIWTYTYCISGFVWNASNTEVQKKSSWDTPGPILWEWWDVGVWHRGTDNQWWLRFWLQHFLFPWPSCLWVLGFIDNISKYPDLDINYRGIVRAGFHTDIYI